MATFLPPEDTLGSSFGRALSQASRGMIQNNLEQLQKNQLRGGLSSLGLNPDISNLSEQLQKVAVHSMLNRQPKAQLNPHQLLKDGLFDSLDDAISFIQQPEWYQQAFMKNRQRERENAAFAQALSGGMPTSPNVQNMTTELDGATAPTPAAEVGGLDQYDPEVLKVVGQPPQRRQFGEGPLPGVGQQQFLSKEDADALEAWKDRYLQESQFQRGRETSQRQTRIERANKPFVERTTKTREEGQKILGLLEDIENLAATKTLHEGVWTNLPTKLSSEDNKLYRSYVQELVGLLAARGGRSREHLRQAEKQKASLLEGSRATKLKTIEHLKGIGQSMIDPADIMDEIIEMHGTQPENLSGLVNKKLTQFKSGLVLEARPSAAGLPDGAEWREANGTTSVVRNGEWIQG